VSTEFDVAADGATPGSPTLAPLDGVTGFRLRRLHGLFVAHWATWFRGRNAPVTPVQGGILLLIKENAGITQVALARLMGVEAPTLTQALNPLVVAGLIERCRSARDGRAYALSLSPPGHAAATVVASEMHRHEADLLSGLTSHERGLLYELLETAIESAEAAGSRGSS
jgi:DNA-binding MarR family transcriptional regulator